MGLLGSLGAIVKQAPKVTAPAGGISIGGRATPAPGASLGRAAGQLAAKPAPRPTGGGIAIGGRASRPVGAPIGQAAGHAAALFHAYKTQPPAQQKAVLTGAILSHSPDGKNLLRMVAPQDSSLWSPKSLPDGLLKGLYGQSGGKALLGLANVAQKYGYVGESQRIAQRYGLTIPWGQLMARDAGPKDQAAIHSIDVGLRLGHATQNRLLTSLGWTPQQIASHASATSDRLKSAPGGNSLVSGAIADLGLNPGTVAASLGRAANIAGTIGGFTARGASAIPRGIADIGIATAQDPSVLPKTVKGLGETAIGGLAGLAQLPVNIAEKGPGPALSQLGSAVGHDYATRYGPLLAGNDKAFIDRIKQQGAGAELFDALLVAGGADATVGRAAAKGAQAAEKLSGKANVLTRVRPPLRISGGEARAQQLAPGAMKITAQRIEDRLRQAVQHAHPAQVPVASGEVAPLLRNVAARKLVSNIASKTRRVMQQQLNAEVRKGAERGMMRLNPWEQRAVPVVGEGFVPLGKGPQAAFDALEARKQAIIAERAKNPGSLGNRIPEQYAKAVDEVHTISQLQANIPKWLTPRLSDYLKQEAKRAPRLEADDPRMQATTAAARRLRPQGESLGFEHPNDTLQRLGKSAEVAGRSTTPNVLSSLGLDLSRARNIGAARDAMSAAQHLDEQRPAVLQKYVDKVRAEARKQGLPEPIYIKHQADPRVDFGSYTTGTGHAAMPGVKQSQHTLWRAGVVDRSPHTYIDSLARSIKAGHQWSLVDQQFRRNAITPDANAIRAALGRRVAAADLTGHELKQVLAHSGVDLKHVRLYRPGRLERSTLEEKGLARAHGSRAGDAPPELDVNAEMHDLLSQHEVSQAAFKSPRPEFLQSPGWKALPKNAFDEIHSSLRPSGIGGRLVGKAQGAAAGAILGTNPSFIVMNTLAHAVLGTFGTRGRILTDAAKFPLWWHGLTEEERNLVRANAGGRGEWRLERLGSTAPEGIRQSWQSFQRLKAVRAVRSASPMRVLFKAEDLQSNFFRHTVYYSATKRMALRDMSRDMPLAEEAATRLQHAFTVGPQQRMAEILRNQGSAEELGRYTVNMMGDYARFTARERQLLNNRAVLFYSFLRHATRTLLYVLPFKHPIATALTAELAKLHNDEVKKMLGGKDLPWAYSRLYFGKGGKLSSVDLMRSSPVGAAGVDVPAQGILGLGGMIPPELQPLLNMVYGKTPEGSDSPRNVFSLINGLASLSYPYRLAQQLHFGTKLQQADSIPFLHERPQKRKSAAGQQYQAAKEAARGPQSQMILGALLGLYPKPDDTRVIAQHQAKKKVGGRSSGGGGVYSPGSGAGVYSPGSSSGVYSP